MYVCSKNVANEGKQSWFLFTEKLLKFLLVFRINLDFLNFINLQKLVKNCYMKKYANNWYIRGRPFNLKGRGVWLFSKKYSDLGGGKKNLIQNL